MAADWPERKVIDLQNEGLLLVEDGNHGEYRPRRDEFGDVGTAFIRAADMANGRVLFESAQKVTDSAMDRIRKGIGAGGDVLLSHKGTVGKVAFVPLDAPPFVCSPQTTFWRTLDNDRIDRRYLYAFLNSRCFHQQLYSRANETDMAGYVSLTAQRQLKVVVPPINEQRAIASILGSLDDKIELNRRMNETLESLARAIFKSWFVDFDPVRAKMDGRQPTGMDQATADLFPDELVHVKGELVPKGWRMVPLSSVAEIVMGTSPKSNTYNYDRIGTPLVNGPVEFGDYFPLTKKWTTAPTRFSKANDLIFCVRGSTTGRRIVADGTYCLGRGVCAIRARNGCQAFINKAIDSEIDRMLLRTTGSVFPNLSAPQIKGFDILLPTDDLVEKFCKYVGPMQNRVEANVVESETLASLRDTLLPKLLSGEIRVGDSAKDVDDVMSSPVAEMAEAEA